MRPSYFSLDSFGRRQEFLTLSSVNSPRKFGSRDLELRANPLDFRFGQRRLLREDRAQMPLSDHLGSGLGLPAYDWSDSGLLNKARDSLVSKLHKGDASLGVTLGSWRQSQEMITNRLKQITGFLRGIRDTPENRRRWNRRQKAAREKEARNGSAKASASQTIANSHLEWIFGWVPLFEDIVSAIEVISGPVAPVFAKGTGKRTTEEAWKAGFAPLTQDVKQTKNDRIRMSCQVQITNPNLWLLNRLGLINPAVVAWDLVPWSFVVGMFVNVTKMIKSLTDFVGLTLSNISITYSTSGFVDIVQRDSRVPGATASCRNVWRFKRRVVTGTIPNPSLQFRVPDMSWGTVAMFASLAVQQATRISKIFR